MDCGATRGCHKGYEEVIHHNDHFDAIFDGGIGILAFVAFDDK